MLEDFEADNFYYQAIHRSIDGQQQQHGFFCRYSDFRLDGLWLQDRDLGGHSNFFYLYIYRLLASCFFLLCITSLMTSAGVGPRRNS